MNRADNVTNEHSKSSVPSVPEREVILELSPPIIKQKKLDNPRVDWCFTWNNYKESDIGQLLDYLYEFSKVFQFQEEIGKNGTPHLQGHLILKTKIRFTGLKKIFNEVHWEPTRDTEKATKYCLKEESRNGRQWEYPEKIKIKVIDEKKLRPCQQTMFDLTFEKPNDREIHWFYDPIGNSGKTSLFKMLVVNYDVHYIMGGKASDILHIISEKIENRSPPIEYEIFLFDFPRCQERRVSYTAIESIKNGIWTSTKYEGKQMVINSPQIIIASNWLPDRDQLSEDRWKIYHIKDQIATLEH